MFIGPPASAIALMGSKRESIAMIEAGVPCVPLVIKATSRTLPY